MNDTNEILENQEKELRKNFEKFWKIASESFINGELSVKELGWSLYKQGHQDPTPQGVDMNYSVFADAYQRDAFINFIEECLEHPNSTTEASKNHYALVTYKCPGHDGCVAWPDRCEDVGGDGETCSTLINLSKLCGIEDNDEIIPKINPKELLTPEEVKTLSDIVSRYNV